LSKNFKAKAIIGLAAIAAASAAAALYFKKKHVQLNVTEFEKAILSKYPGANIISIEKTFVDDNIYTVTAIIDEKEYRLYVTVDGEIVESTPRIPE
jgi:hypothetical protein